MITVVRYIGNAELGLVDVYYRETVAATAGNMTVDGHLQLVEGSDADLDPGTWGNEDLVAAVAARLGISSALAEMAAPPPRPVATGTLPEIVPESVPELVAEVVAEVPDVVPAVEQAPTVEA